MDFGVWTKGTAMDSANTNAQQHGGDQRPPPSGNGNGVGRGSGQVFAHQVEHPGVVCDNCNKGICGFRYKCCQCKDYDLCSTCERNGIHAGHVMLRIAFPEMANDAIRSYILKSPQETLPIGFAGAAAAAPTFDSEHGRKRHCKRERHAAFQDVANAGASEVPPAFGSQNPQCPVVMGKKEIKKWAKYMRKTAHMHKRMAAEALGTNANGEPASGMQSEGAGGPGNVPPQQPAFDFSAAASQIQEFLNAFGVPIDVVELYDEWGNRGTPNSEQATGSNSSVGTQDGKKEMNASGESSSNAEAITGTSVPQGDLADNFENLTIGPESTRQGEARDVNSEPGNENEATATGVTAPATATPETQVATNTSGRSSLSGSENEGGWTFLEDERADVPIVEADPAITEVTPTPTSDANQSQEGGLQIPMAFDGGALLNPINLASNIAESEAPTSDNDSTQAQSATPTPATPSPRSTQSQISPSLQQVFDGLSTTVGNVVRGFTGSASGGGIFARTSDGNGVPAPNTPPELNDRMQTTLNQLLSMGFSNHDGWLAKLVASKNGNLEEVLNSLFPVESTRGSNSST